ncbi:MAG: M48 family metalloprotease [Abditibacteriales bacterium]|nr:M48 family metalloprotease [Abditibacteriales bacterium]MDW8366715.1 M48 family metalloprotease [Abditibacteriales bacterium]
MTREQFDAMVWRLEAYSRQHPSLYRLRVALLAGLGYLYIFFVLAIALGLLALLGYALISGHARSYALKFGWAGVLFVGIILRAMWVRLAPPEGREVRPAEVPPLFRMIEELRSTLRTPRFHHVLVTSDFNAAAAQRPRLGVLGWQCNYLLFGLPLMQALSPEQFRAVVAHELGHLSGNHGRLGGWIYRVEQTWSQLLERLEAEHHWGTKIFQWFFHWYAPFFNAYSFALRRANEYLADRCAAELTSTQHAAEALLNFEVKKRLLQEVFWADIYKQADNQPQPTAQPFAAMATALRSGPQPEEAVAWLDRALARKTDTTDTHPALADRLRALGYLQASDGGDAPAHVPLPPPLTQNAAEFFLGEALPCLVEHFDLAWQKAVQPKWQERHQYAQQARQTLRELEEKAQSQPLTEKEAFTRARLTAEFGDQSAAIPLLQEVLARQPQHAPANYLLGRLLLAQGEAIGIQYLDNAMNADAEAIPHGCELAYQFLMERGQAQEAARYRERALHYFAEVAAARQERSGVNLRDQFEPHNLAPETVQRVREQLARYTEVAAAYLVRKVVRYFPERPYYVLGVVPHHPRWTLNRGAADGRLLQRLVKELESPGETYLIILSGQARQLERTFRPIAGAQIFQRET